MTDDRYERATEALRQAEEMNRRIVESTGDCVKILGIGGELIYINPEGLRALELTDASAFLGLPFATPLPPDQRERAEAAIALARQGGRGRLQYLMRTASGRARWWDAVVTPITDIDGTVVQLLVVSRDVTERRHEENLRAGQHRVLEMIAIGSPLMAVLESIVRLVERESEGMACTVLLLDDDGITIRHGAAPTMPAGYLQALEGLTIGPKAGSCGTAMFRGEPVIVTDVLTDPLWEGYTEVATRFGFRACWSTPIFSPDRKVLGSLAMYYAEPRAPRDDERRVIETAAGIARIAIEQHRAHEALRHSEARNRAILRAIPDWMFLTTRDGLILDFHAQDPTKLYAPPSTFLGRRVVEVLPAQVAQPLTEAFARAITSNEPEKVEYSLPAGEDAERFFEAVIVTCDGDKILSMVRDITDRRRAELEADSHRRELAHLGRVATLGELTGALAHELSQPLTAVLNNAEAARRLVDRDPPDLEQIRAALDDIIRNDRRAGTVIDRLRSLLRKGDTVRQTIDVNDVVRETLDLAFGELLSRRVAVTRTLDDAVAPVLGDRVQLQQVVLNLVMNACDAMDGTPAADRRLVVSTANGEGYVRLAVTDRGRGIPDGQLEQVFEPFVTFRDRGLGLGLAISRSIVKAHGGSIRAENNADGGATFHCALPAVGVRRILGLESASAARGA
jgi:PAS domain S-box-containing protein